MFIELCELCKYYFLQYIVLTRLSKISKELKNMIDVKKLMKQVRKFAYSYESIF